MNNILGKKNFHVYVKSKANGSWVQLTVTPFDTEQKAQKHIDTVLQPYNDSLEFTVQSVESKKHLIIDKDDIVRGEIELFDSEIAKIQLQFPFFLITVDKYNSRKEEKEAYQSSTAQSGVYA